MFEWLKDYQRLEDEIELLEFNIERNKNELKRWVDGDLAKVKLTAESHGAKLEEIIEKGENELAHKKDDLCKLKQIIKSFRGLDNQILYMKYVEGKTLEVIADELKYSYGYIKRKHAEIMKMMKFADSIKEVINE